MLKENSVWENKKIFSHNDYQRSEIYPFILLKFIKGQEANGLLTSLGIETALTLLSLGFFRRVYAWERSFLTAANKAS